MYPTCPRQSGKNAQIGFFHHILSTISYSFNPKDSSYLKVNRQIIFIFKHLINSIHTPVNIPLYIVHRDRGDGSSVLGITHC